MGFSMSGYERVPSSFDLWAVYDRLLTELYAEYAQAMAVAGEERKRALVRRYQIACEPIIRAMAGIATLREEPSTEDG